MSFLPKYWPRGFSTNRKHIEIHLKAVDEAYKAIKDMPRDLESVLAFGRTYDDSVSRQINEFIRTHLEP